MKLTINTYAAVKELFGESFEMEIENGSTIDELREKIVKINPASEGIINKCRFAINESIVNGNTPIKEAENVHIIPPSSGG
ncbi:MAG: MoaD/ThiS family protein [Ignavibacteriaceae bacterium]|nr:MoaD/ThiS family protein [Ignavibacteriaceae bacterium]